MTGITEASSFDATVNRYDISDPVLGGLAGESNDPIIALANRTRFLYDYVNGQVDVVAVTGNATIGAAHVRKLVYINVSANTTITLTKTTNLLTGQRLSFVVKTTGIKSVKFVPDVSGTADVIINLPSPFTALWLHNGEQIDLIKLADNVWWLVDIKTNLSQVANDGMVRRQPQNTFVANGSGGLLRADTARLWDAVSAGSTVAEATWFSDILSYRSLFATGDTTTTFRLPDMRSMGWRGLDAGRGISVSRLGSAPGSYEADKLKSHGHTLATTNTDRTNNDTADPMRGTIPGTPSTRGGAGSSNSIGETGDNETVGKNAGLIPIIYY